MSSVHIYWDESHFWGLLVRRALVHWGIPHRLVRAEEIAQGVLSGKSAPCLLVVPGGRARGKAQRLGEAGMRAVRDFVAGGGNYLGFCGGAGLALTGPDGLGLCPWSRKGFTNRLHHFLSGHMHASLNVESPLVPASLGESALLPVWWPGRFDPLDDGVEVLARYQSPGPDFWVADLNLKKLPKGTMSDWETLYGISLRPDFMRGQPCVTANAFGQGQVVLSYAHLETPASPHANRWLAHILDQVAGLSCEDPHLPAWDLDQRPVVWEDQTLAQARTALKEVIATGSDHFLLFWRTPWLLGWRRGIPGAGINALYALVCEAQALAPTPGAEAFWQEHAAHFSQLVELLRDGLTGYLLAERLAMTVFHTAKDAIDSKGLREQRAALFGTAPEPGGVYAELLQLLESLYPMLAAD